MRRRRSPLNHHSGKSRRGQRRGGYTLVEMIVAIGSASVLMVGMGSVVMLSTQSFKMSDTPVARQVEAADVQRQMFNDLRYASSFSERTNNAVTFTVPDRTGDGRPDTLRYVWGGTAGGPLTYTLNGGTPQTLLASVESLTFDFLTQTHNAPVIPDEDGSLGTILFVSAGQIQEVSQTFFSGGTSYVQPTATELVTLQQLESAGFTLEVINDDAEDSDVASALAGADVVFISGETNDSALSPNFFNTTLGVVNACDDAVADFGFCEKSQTVSHSSLSIFTNEHYITQELSTGPLLVSERSMDLLQMDGAYSTELQSLAKDYNQTGHAFLALNANAVRYDETGKVAARRVQLPFGFGSYDPTALNIEGQKLVIRSIEWAMGNGDDGIPNVQPTTDNFGYESKLKYPDWGFNRKQIATMVELSQSGTLKSITAYLSYWEAGAKVAIYTDKNGEPDRLIAESGIETSDRRGAWITFSMPDTDLTAGTYWLAIGLEHFDQEIFWEPAPGGKLRVVNYDAFGRGFSSSWGRSSIYWNDEGMSVYGTIEVAP